MVGEFWEAPVVFRPTVATPVFDDVVAVAPAPSVSWVPRQARAQVEGDDDVVADSPAPGVTWGVPPMPDPVLSGFDTVQELQHCPVTWGVRDPSASIDNGSDIVAAAEPAGTTWDAMTPVAQVDDISMPTVPPIAYWGAPTAGASIGAPSDPMRSGVSRRFVDLDRVHEYPKGTYVVRQGAACSRIGHGVRPLQEGEEFAGFAVEHAAENDPYVAVQPVGVVELDVEGVTGPADIGTEVRAMHSNRFTIVGGSGSSIGRVVTWVRGRRCRVWFEAPAYGSL